MAWTGEGESSQGEKKECFQVWNKGLRRRERGVRQRGRGTQSAHVSVLAAGLRVRTRVDPPACGVRASENHITGCAASSLTVSGRMLGCAALFTPRKVV